MNSKSAVFRQTGIIALGVFILSLLMLGVYGLLGLFSRKVIFGALAGWLLAVGNFLLMSIVLSVAADKATQQDLKDAKMLVQGSYVGRLALLFILLFAFLKSGFCDPIAMVLPLIFVRPVIVLQEFFGKKGGNPT